MTPAESVIDLVLERVEQAPHHDSFLVRPTPESKWRPVSTRQFLDAVNHAAAHLIRAGVERGDRVLIWGATSYAWAIADFAVWRAGAIGVPVYPSASPDQVASIVADAEPALAVVDADLPQLAPENRSGLGSLPVITLTELARHNDATVEEIAELSRRSPSGADLATIVYTSGTTGEPRGVEITHANLVSQVRSVAGDYPGLVNDQARTVIFLPLAHILARALQVAAVASGMTVAHIADPTAAVAALGEVQPTFLVVAPRVLEKIAERVQLAADEKHLGKIFAAARKLAITRGRRLEFAQRLTVSERVRFALFDALFYRRIRTLLGGQITALMSGAAPLDPQLSWFFRGMGVPVVEGYGLTETTAPATGNRLDAVRAGSVGVALSGTSVRIAEPDDSGVGEVQVKGPGVTRGYRNQPPGTGFTDDGYLRTGDLGRLDADGFLTLTGRANDLIITSGGKNIMPIAWEQAVERSPEVEFAVMVGDRRPYPAALLFIGGNSDPATPYPTTSDRHLRRSLQHIVDAANRTVSKPEQVKRWVAVSASLSEATGELTATGKIRRDIVLTRAQHLIDELYR